MKIVFMGTGDFAVPSLQAIVKAGLDVALVVSQPDRPKGRGLTLSPTPVKAAAQALVLPVFQPERLRLEPERVIDCKADILVVVAYGQILRENILECAPRGAVNVHASLLPKYRGAAPIQWALARGETRTGVTTMQLDRGMDTGPILLQRECAVGPEETTATLEPKLADLGASLLLETLDGLTKGTLKPTPQDDRQSTKAPLIRKSEGFVDFRLDASDIVNRLRGFSPWPGVQFSHEGRSIKLLGARTLSESATEAALPGTIARISRDGLDVVCAPGSILRLLRVQPESRGAMDAFDFANGAKLREGQKLGGHVPGAPSASSGAKD